MNMRNCFLFLAAFLFQATACGPANAKELVTSLSEHLVSITSSFTGSEILVFGAVGETSDDPTLSPFETYDIAIVVRGPPVSVVTRNKQRTAGIWVNRRSVQFGDVPGFYAIASTGPLREIARETVLLRHQIGTEFLRFPLERAAGPDDPIVEDDYRRALIQLLANSENYRDEIGKVTFLGERLFRWTVKLPANVPVGVYKVEVYLLRGGQITGAQTSPLFVHKIGIERGIFRLATEQPFLYGLLAVLIALGAGWAANAALSQD